MSIDKDLLDQLMAGRSPGDLYRTRFFRHLVETYAASEATAG